MIKDKLKIRAWLLLSSFMLLAACGSSPSNPSPPSPPPSTQVIDPSGNWQLTAQDSTGAKFYLGAVFDQVGSTVTVTGSNIQGFNISVPPEPTGYACGKISLNLADGSVANVDQFSGAVTFADLTGTNLGAMTFAATLNEAGSNFTGTYSGLLPCTGLLPTGTLTGQEVPSTTGTWSLTLTPCAFTGQTCVSTGGAASSMTITLEQFNDINGADGDFIATGTPHFYGGRCATGLTISGSVLGQQGGFTLGPGIISGTDLELICSDDNTTGNGAADAMINGTISTSSSSFTGLMTLYNAPQPTSVAGYYAVTATW